MNWFWLNIPLMVVFFLAIAGIPLWLTFRRPDGAQGAAMQQAPVIKQPLVARAEPETRRSELVGASR